jgi:hypothetical protein
LLGLTSRASSPTMSVTGRQPLIGGLTTDGRQQKVEPSR